MFRPRYNQQKQQRLRANTATAIPGPLIIYSTLVLAGLFLRLLLGTVRLA